MSAIAKNYDHTFVTKLKPPTTPQMWLSKLPLKLWWNIFKLNFLVTTIIEVVCVTSLSQITMLNINRLNAYSDTTLTNYGESAPSTNMESEVIETYSDSSLNVETVHKADEHGNLYSESSDNFSSQPDTLTDVTDQYEPYINEYAFDTNHTNDTNRIQTESVEVPETDIENRDITDMNDYQHHEKSNYESHMTEEMLMSEREREKKSKKELEEEEREKMQ